MFAESGAPIERDASVHDGGLLELLRAIEGEGSPAAAAPSGRPSGPFTQGASAASRTDGLFDCPYTRQTSQVEFWQWMRGFSFVRSQAMARLNREQLLRRIQGQSGATRHEPSWDL